MDLLLQNQSDAHMREYVEKHNLEKVFQDMVYGLSINKPGDVISYLVQFLEKPNGPFSLFPIPNKVVPRICLVSPPTCGSQLVASHLASALNVPIISVGDALKKAVEKNTVIGGKARKYLDRNQIVPDDVICPFVMDLLQEAEADKKGFVLEGFPATREQLFYLQSKGLSVDHYGTLHLPFSPQV